jgi:15-cis-phytoene synthase
MSETHSPDETAAFCANEVRAQDFTYYAAALFAGPEQRRALHALYAFNIEITRVRDHISQPLPGEIRLQWWADTLNGSGHGGVEGHPVAAELLRAIGEFDLPVAELVGMIDANRFDLYDDPMPTLDALETHLAETDVALYSLAARICQPRGGAFDDIALHAGLAYGLMRVICLLPRHAARRQLYLPQQLLDLNAVGIEDIFAGKVVPGLRAVLAVLIREAQIHLEAARSAVLSTPAEILPAFLPLAVAHKILKRMEQADFNPLQPVQPSRLAVLWATWRASRGSL